MANVWDVPSVKAAEKLEFQAIGTSSSAISKLLGYPDGEKMEFSELEYIVKRIAHNTNLPFSVDLEAGYSRKAKEITNYIKRLVDVGVVGINLEDSIVNGSRTLLNSHKFSETLFEITNLLQKENINIFINVRTDTFLLEHSNTINETKMRIGLYENAGADGIFTPCIVNTSDIEEIVDSTDLPINVMCMPNLPDFDTLADLGVKRISMGDFMFDAMYNDYEELTKEILTKKSFKSIF